MHHNKVTIKDIAATAKVSKSTVSRVLNNTTPVNEKKRKAVLRAMKKLNFKPNVFARSLAGGQSMTIGVVTQNIGSPFYDSVVQGVTRGLTDTDYSPIFVDGQWQPELERSGIITLIDRRVDGLIMVGGSLESQTLDELRHDVPMVLAARQLPGWEDRSVAIDNLAAARTATRYLIEAGHRNIAHITGIRHHSDANDRLEGFKAAMADADLDVKEELIVEGDFSSQSGVMAMETLLLRGVTFSAVFAANDEIAFGARLVLYRHGIRVPEDVSIIGFDDEAVSAYMTPPLTTIAQPALEMGSTVAALLMGMIKKEPVRAKPLEAELVIRESVARRT